MYIVNLISYKKGSIMNNTPIKANEFVQYLQYIVCICVLCINTYVGVINK